MQPPDTEPTRMPSSRIAASEPGGRGLAPKVCATVSSQTRRPSRFQSRARSRTSRSRLCIGGIYRGLTAACGGRVIPFAVDHFPGALQTTLARGLAAGALLLCAQAWAFTPPAELVITTDENYPPYLFRSED